MRRWTTRLPVLRAHGLSRYSSQPPGLTLRQNRKAPPLSRRFARGHRAVARSGQAGRLLVARRLTVVVRAHQLHIWERKNKQWACRSTAWGWVSRVGWRIARRRACSTRAKRSCKTHCGGSGQVVIRYGIYATQLTAARNPRRRARNSTPDLRLPRRRARARQQAPQDQARLGVRRRSPPRERARVRTRAHRVTPLQP